MYLIVGLGNPEKDYENTRHNMGFNVINRICEKYGIEIKKTKFKGLYELTEIEGEKVILLKPQTYMNLSGESVREAASFYKIDPENIIVVYDDIDLEPGTIRIRKFGGPGTHNGMKSIVNCLQSENFPRIRVGIGKPIEKDLVEYVIGAISKEDKKKLEEGIEKATNAVIDFLKNDLDFSMNKYN